GPGWLSSSSHTPNPSTPSSSITQTVISTGASTPRGGSLTHSSGASSKRGVGTWARAAQRGASSGGGPPGVGGRIDVPEGPTGGGETSTVSDGTGGGGTSTVSDGSGAPAGRAGSPSPGGVGSGPSSRSCAAM